LSTSFAIEHSERFGNVFPKSTANDVGWRYALNSRHRKHWHHISASVCERCVSKQLYSQKFCPNSCMFVRKIFGNGSRSLRLRWLSTGEKPRI